MATLPFFSIPRVQQQIMIETKFLDLAGVIQYQQMATLDGVREAVQIEG